MIAYDDVRTTNPDNVFSSAIISAFDKAIAYDDIRESIIGLRNSAWANGHNDIFSAKVITYVTRALLENDHELLRMLQIPLVELSTVEIK